MINHFTNRKPAAGTEVEDAAALAIRKPTNTQNMRIDQIADMHVVPDAGAVWRVVICTVNRQSIPLAVDCVQHQGNQMGFGPMEFAHLSFRVCAGYVEIAEYDMS